MSAIKIEITSIGYGMSLPRTHVSVDGKHAYQTIHHPTIEKENLEKIIQLAHLDNIEVVVK